MAWRNADVTIYGLTQSMVNDFSWCNSPQQNVNKVSVNAILPQNAGIIEDSYAWGNNIGLALYCLNSGSNFQFLGYNNGAYFSALNVLSSDLRDTETYVGYSYICCIDDETQKGILCFIWQNLNNNVWGWNHAPVTGGNNYQYQLITANLNINYNWISVPSVSGKNGILSLAQIKAESINDGEPVSGASVLAFDSLGNVNIPAIIDEQMPIDPSDPTSVTVGYLIPPLTSGQYSALKILVKQDNIPKDENDADKVVDIEEPTNLLRVGSAVVSGLTPLSHYYFVVKVTDDADVSATSEPKDITLDVAPLDTFFAPDFGTDGKDITRYNASKTIHVHMDIGYVAYDVDYYAAQGALADPSSPSNPAYTISNGEITTADDYQYLCWAYDVSANQRIIPSNCTLWFEFDAFFVNEEGYLDWRMYDDSGLEIIYWCWDTKYAFDANIWYNCKLEATVVNGIITQIKYYVDNDMVSQSVTNIHMLCIDEDNPRPLYFITFQTTELTKLKNMKIYWE